MKGEKNEELTQEKDLKIKKLEEELKTSEKNLQEEKNKNGEIKKELEIYKEKSYKT